MGFGNCYCPFSMNRWNSSSRAVVVADTAERELDFRRLVRRLRKVVEEEVGSVDRSKQIDKIRKTISARLV